MLSPEDALAQTEPVASAMLPMRFEDVDQRGRVTLPAIASALGEVCWRGHLKDHAIRAFEKDGIVAIQSRMVTRFGQAMISAESNLEAIGRVLLARTERDGEVERLLLLLSVDVFGRASSTYDPQPANAGERVWLGYGFHEGVFTRPFAKSRERRRVRLLPDVGVPTRPEALVSWPSRVPEFETDDTHDRDVTFGMLHSDANQHVNSLVYPRMLEELVVETTGHTSGLSRFEMTYRKPSFVGERATWKLALGDGEASGLLIGAGEERPRVFGRLVFTD